MVSTLCLELVLPIVFGGGGLLVIVGAIIYWYKRRMKWNRDTHESEDGLFGDRDFVQPSKSSFANGTNESLCLSDISKPEQAATRMALPHSATSMNIGILGKPEVVDEWMEHRGLRRGENYIARYGPFKITCNPSHGDHSIHGVIILYDVKIADRKKWKASGLPARMEELSTGGPWWDQYRGTDLETLLEEILRKQDRKQPAWI
ncbi:Fc.00g082260.m01.CDS01 [Cosmosporella sp. VM-42]